MPYVPLNLTVTVTEGGNMLHPWFRNSTDINVPQEGGKAFIFRVLQDQAAKADKGKEGTLDVYVTVDGAPVPGLEGGIQNVTYKEWERMRRAMNKVWDDLANELVKKAEKEGKHKKKKG